MKKVLFIIYQLFCIYSLFSLDFKDIIELAYENNQDLALAKVEYEKALLGTKTKNGVYSSGLSAKVSLPSQENNNLFVDDKNIVTSITYSKNLPGNLGLDITANYSVNYSALNFTIYQSLKPFWIKGKIKDPNICSLQLQKEYYWYELNYQKKTIIENIIQLISKIIIYNNECKMLNNDISLLQMKINAQEKLCKAGNSNKSQITELESEKWSKQQNLINYEIQIENYLLDLKTLCGAQFDLDDLENIIDLNNTDILADFIELEIDPIEKKLQLKNELLNQNYILQNQKSSPVLSFSFQPVWKPELKEGMYNWTSSIGIDFSPLIESANKKESKLYEIEYKQSIEELALYQKKKEFLIEQCDNALNYYNKILENSKELYKKTLEELEDYKLMHSTGSISELDYESVKQRVNNIQITIRNLQLNIWVYNIQKDLLWS